MRDFTEAEVLKALVAAPEPHPAAVEDTDDEPVPRRLRAVDAFELLKLDLPPREMLLAPWLPLRGLAMVYSKRGVGKTHLALGIAFAAATGSAFLRWRAPKPCRVLYVDGEMPAGTLKERFANIVAGSDADMPDGSNLRFLAADLSPDGIPDLCTDEGKQAIEEHIADGIDLLIIDNLSTLCRSGKENESESWAPVQEWALSLRRNGVAVLFVHHAGKGGAQRGTSKREDVLDTVIALRQPEDYSPTDGARFEVHLEKARGVFGDDAKPFEARLETREGVATWTMRDLEDVTLRRVVELSAEGCSVRDIAGELGISRSKVQRLIARNREAANG